MYTRRVGNQTIDEDDPMKMKIFLIRGTNRLMLILTACCVRA